MSLFKLADKAQLAQLTVATVLDSACRLSGAEKSLARAAGITPIFLSNIRHQIHMPSLLTARRIAAHLPLPIGEQQKWLDAVRDYWIAKRTVVPVVKERYIENPGGLLAEITQLHVLGRYTGNPDRGKECLSQVITLVAPIVTSCSPERDPLLFIELCSLLHESYSATGRLVQGLMLARYARWIIDALALKVVSGDRRTVAMQRVRAMYLEMISLNDLNLHRKARDLSVEIEYAVDFPLIKQHWVPVLSWNRMIAMAQIPRTSIFEAESLANIAHQAVDSSRDTFVDISHMLIARALGEVYISHASWKKAKNLLMKVKNSLPGMLYVGTLHKVMFLRTLARYYWLMPAHESDLWQQTIDEAREIALHAGLYAQLSQINEDYRHHLSNNLI